MLCRINNTQLDWPEASLWTVSGLTVSSHQLIWLQGRNGVGKSTWLRIIAGLLPAKGFICWAKRSCEVLGLQPCFLTLLCEGYSLDDKVVSIIAREYCLRMGVALAPKDLLQLCTDAGLSFCLDLCWGQLSRGQRQWVALLPCAYVNVAVWLLDEPFLSLDFCHSMWLNSCINRQLSLGGAVIMSSHDRPCNFSVCVHLQVSKSVYDA